MAGAVPLTAEELVRVCAEADDAAHCGRLVEEVQLPRLPNLAVRDKLDLRVSLYPSGIATFTDTETLHGGRSYSLWDFMSEINAVVLYVTDGDDASFTLLQRTNGRKFDLPSDPKLSPDRQRLVTADFCERRCVNELALWRVTKDGVRKELTWRPRRRGPTRSRRGRMHRQSWSTTRSPAATSGLASRASSPTPTGCARRPVKAARACRKSGGLRAPPSDNQELRAPQRTDVARAAAGTRHAVPKYGIRSRRRCSTSTRVRPPRTARARDRIRHG
jgi:hypothetical protein